MVLLPCSYPQYHDKRSSCSSNDRGKDTLKQKGVASKDGFKLGCWLLISSMIRHMEDSGTAKISRIPPRKKANMV